MMKSNFTSLLLALLSVLLLISCVEQHQSQQSFYVNGQSTDSNSSSSTTTTTASASSTTTTLISSSSTTVETQTTTITSGTTASPTPPPPTTTIPVAENILFTVFTDKVYNQTFLENTFAAAIGNGCTANDIRILFLNQDTQQNVTVQFIGSKAADFAHRFLYDVLEKNANSVNVQGFSYSAQAVPSSGDNHSPDDQSPDTKKIIIAASVVGVLLLIVLVCGIRNGKCCKKCCSGDEETWKTPRGSELAYSHDDLAEYRKIK